MSPEQADLLTQARRSLAAAKAVLELGYTEVAVSRAYYAMFYCASALLRGEGLSFSKHSAVIAAFGRHFARTGRVPADLHHGFVQAEKARLVADYVAGRSVPAEEAGEQIKRAERFLAVTEELIGACSAEP
ncbi:MAG: HEPN domain-containing protein [Acidobacteria bacterium]|nr:HEPN domain-containing protein [Acidobacteriota bacterium]